MFSIMDKKQNSRDH